MSGNFAFSLTDLVTIEVTIDGNYVSTPVPGGDVWCIASYSDSQPIATQ